MAFVLPAPTLPASATMADYCGVEDFVPEALVLVVVPVVVPPFVIVDSTKSDSGCPPTVSASPALSAYGMLTSNTRGCSASCSTCTPQPAGFVGGELFSGNSVGRVYAEQNAVVSSGANRDILYFLPQRRAAFMILVQRKRDARGLDSVPHPRAEANQPRERSMKIPSHS